MACDVAAFHCQPAGHLATLRVLCSHLAGLHVEGERNQDVEKEGGLGQLGNPQRGPGAQNTLDCILQGGTGRVCVCV